MQLFMQIFNIPPLLIMTSFSWNLRRTAKFKEHICNYYRVISISVIVKWSKHSGPTYIPSMYLYRNQEVQNTAYVISQESEIGSLTYRFHTYWELPTGFSGNSWNFTTHLDTIRLRQARPENLIRKNKIAKFLQVLKHLKVNGRYIFLWKHRLNFLT